MKTKKEFINILITFSFLCLRFEFPLVRMILLRLITQIRKIQTTEMEITMIKRKIMFQNLVS